MHYQVQLTHTAKSHKTNHEEGMVVPEWISIS